MDRRFCASIRLNHTETLHPKNDSLGVQKWAFDPKALLEPRNRS